MIYADRDLIYANQIKRKLKSKGAMLVTKTNEVSKD